MAETPIHFTLPAKDGAWGTSAGVFRPDGTLVRTLWRKEELPAGDHNRTWDDRDDDGRPAAAGEYEVRVLYHDVRHEWEGAIGNTSADQTGPAVHAAFRSVRAMAVSGDSAYYCTGYNEGGTHFKRFDTRDPRRLTAAFSATWDKRFNRPATDRRSNAFDKTWLDAATDGQKVYFAAAAGFNLKSDKTDAPGFVVRFRLPDLEIDRFPAGRDLPLGTYGDPNYPDDQQHFPYPGAVEVGAKPGVSGLAVQADGSWLAVSVAPDDKVYLFDKESGKPAGSLQTPAPGRMAWAPRGRLYACSGGKVRGFESLPGESKVAVELPGLVAPLAVAVAPGGRYVLVADGGTSQQLKAFTPDGQPLWTYGQGGGYAVNGADVRPDKFWFDNGESDNHREDTFLAFQPDGAFWVGDGGNHRALRFAASADKAPEYRAQLAWMPHAYVASADPNRPERVTCDFLEFAVDYDQPIGEGWKLVKNWGAGLPAKYHASLYPGLNQVTTLANGRAYAFTGAAGDATVQSELVELAGDRLRFTGWRINREDPHPTLAPDGTLRLARYDSGMFQHRKLRGFDVDGNPDWGPAEFLASAPAGKTDPIPRCCSGFRIAVPVTESGVVVSFDPSKNEGWHLGGIKAGGKDWLWKGSPSKANNVPIDGLGSFGIGNGVHYPGNVAMAAGRHVVYGYHGEFFNGGQAGQHMHFYDDGLFIGQFGVDSPTSRARGVKGVAPEFAGNAMSPSLVLRRGEVYLWVNDEAGHGPQRWHLSNLTSVRELTGSGRLGVGIRLAVAPPGAKR